MSGDRRGARVWSGVAVGHPRVVTSAFTGAAAIVDLDHHLTCHPPATSTLSPIAMRTHHHHCNIPQRPVGARAAPTRVELATAPLDLAAARVCRTREHYRRTVAAYLGAGTAEERARLGKAMYFAQLATIEARHNPEGCEAFITAAAALTVAGGRSPGQIEGTRRAA